jgi:hypothetical protein
MVNKGKGYGRMGLRYVFNIILQNVPLKTEEITKIIKF